MRKRLWQRPTLIWMSKGETLKKVQEQIRNSCPPCISAAMARPQLPSSAECLKFFSAFKVPSLYPHTFCFNAFLCNTENISFSLCDGSEPISQMTAESTTSKSLIKNNYWSAKQILQQFLCQTYGKMCFPNTRASEIRLTDEAWEENEASGNGIKNGKKVIQERDFTDPIGKEDILELSTVLKGDRQYLNI